LAVRALRDSGAEVVVETGAAIVSQASEAWFADLVVKVKEPLPPSFLSCPSPPRSSPPPEEAIR